MDPENSFKALPIICVCLYIYMFGVVFLGLFLVCLFFVVVLILNKRFIFRI